MSFGRRLARRRLDHAITPTTFVATALGVELLRVSWSFVVAGEVLVRAGDPEEVFEARSDLLEV
jgi:hypothetical protein